MTFFDDQAMVIPTRCILFKGWLIMDIVKESLDHRPHDIDIDDMSLLISDQNRST